MDGHALLAIKRGMEVRREEYLDYMTFKANERPMFIEIFGPLIGLREEWIAQGGSVRGPVLRFVTTVPAQKG